MEGKTIVIERVKTSSIENECTWLREKNKTLLKRENKENI